MFNTITKNETVVISGEKAILIAYKGHELSESMMQAIASCFDHEKGADSVTANAVAAILKTGDVEIKTNKNTKIRILQAEYSASALMLSLEEMSQISKVKMQCFSISWDKFVMELINVEKAMNEIADQIKENYFETHASRD